MFSKCLFESLFSFTVPTALQNCPITTQRRQAVYFQPGLSILSDFGLLAHSVVSPVILLHARSLLPDQNKIILSIFYQVHKSILSL
jgi:hypothetical protein